MKIVLILSALVLVAVISIDSCVATDGSEYMVWDGENFHPVSEEGAKKLLESEGHDLRRND